jgi:hypothetical protein
VETLALRRSSPKKRLKTAPLQRRVRHVVTADGRAGRPKSADPPVSMQGGAVEFCGLLLLMLDSYPERSPGPAPDVERFRRSRASGYTLVICVPCAVTLDFFLNAYAQLAHNSSLRGWPSGRPSK